MPTLQCNDTELYYEDRGEGAPVVFLHGMMAGSRFFTAQMDAFEDAYRPIALDFRGHGRSAKTETGHLLPQYARDLQAFLAALSLEDVVLVGHSMGASVAWEYVEQFGTERLCGLVVVDQPAAEFAWPDNEDADVDLERMWQLMELVQTDAVRFNELAVEVVFADAASVSPETRRLVFDEFSRCPPPIKSAIVFDETLRDYRDVLPGLDLPTLVCAGADESFVPVAPVEHVADLVPDAEFVVFEESGHCPMLEEPDRFDAEVERFVESLSPSVRT